MCLKIGTLVAFVLARVGKIEIFFRKILLKISNKDINYDEIIMGWSFWSTSTPNSDGC
jgi:hypothetical protein